MLPIYTYETYVEKLIREKYTVSDELAILRQRDSKPEKFAEYNAFCEDCKVKSREFMKSLEIHNNANKF